MQFTLGAGKSLAVILALAAASIVSGCTPPSLKYPTRSVSPKVFRDRVTTLAYSPLFTTKDAQTDQFVNAVGGQLGRRLQSIGVTLLRPEPWNECWLPAVEEAGGLYNARTGEFDEQKEARVRWKDGQVEKKSGLLHNHETIARAVKVALRPLLSEENN